MTKGDRVEITELAGRFRAFRYEGTVLRTRKATKQELNEAGIERVVTIRVDACKKHPALVGTQDEYEVVGGVLFGSSGYTIRHKVL